MAYGGSRICETCGCFRSRHLRGKECSCGCEEFLFTPPKVKKINYRRFTPEEIDRAKTMLDAGATYAEVARKLGRHWNIAIRNRFPGYEGDSDRQAHTEAVKDRWQATEEREKAHRAFAAAERKAKGLPTPRRACSFEGNECGRPAYGHGLCRTHYMQWRKDTELRPIGEKMGREPTHVSCTFDGCDRKHYAHGLCTTHYAQRRRGKPLTQIRQR